MGRTASDLAEQAYRGQMFGRRDARAAAKWVRFAEHAAHHGLTIVHIVDVYEVARNGTKAVITVYGSPRAHDAWFWWDNVAVGTTLAVALSTGYGPHTHRDGVIFVGGQTTGSGVYDRLGPRVLARAQRHQIRFETRQPRLVHGSPGRSSLPAASEHPV